MTDAPEVHTTTTAAGPAPATAYPGPTTTAPIPTTVAAPEHTDAPADYAPDLNALKFASGSPGVWAHELYELIGHTTGKWIDETSLEGWMSTFAAQVQQATYRSAMFQIANTTLPTQATGDAAVLLLQLRDELATGLKRAAGV